MSNVHSAVDPSGHGHGGHTELGFFKKYVFSEDHKVIGMQFLATTLVMLMVGGSLALGVRFQLAWPWRAMPFVHSISGGLFGAEGGQISPEFYTMLFTMHATVMT